MKKTIPTFKTDKEAEAFVATADLSQYDLSGGQVMRFEMKPKDSSLNQRFIRMALERALHDPK
jgi:predicted DNA binding CopG/RHH family protein